MGLRGLADVGNVSGQLEVAKTSRSAVQGGPRTLWVCCCPAVFAGSDQGCERRLPTGLSCGCFPGLAARCGGLLRFRRHGRSCVRLVHSATSADAFCGRLSDDGGWLGTRLRNRRACPSSDGLESYCQKSWRERLEEGGVSC